jgi:GreA/GreB family transcription elongation factor
MTRRFLTMSDLAIRQPSANQRWPMTGEALRTLVDEIGRLRADVVTLAGASALNSGVVHLSAVRAARRFEVLTAVLAAEEVQESNRAVIGRRVTLLEEEGESVCYALVFPGDGDPAQGWISADSPLGAAVLHSSPGDVVQVMAPAGQRVVAVISVE